MRNYTVEQLIKHLEKFPKKQQVVICYDDSEIGYKQFEVSEHKTLEDNPQTGKINSACFIYFNTEKT